MNENIFVESIQGIPTFKKRFEIVERKGLGHPDTICDLVMNQLSVELSKFYQDETGSVQHHNMDKGLLVAGQTENKFGGGKVKKPMKLVIGDRATFTVNGKDLPIEDFVVKNAQSWFEKNLRFVKKEHVEYEVEIGATSKELQSVFKNPNEFTANDTSALVGYAPVTDTESIILKTEKFINSNEFKKEFPESGEDVKVMGFRNYDHLDLTIAIAIIDRFIDSEKKYFEKKKQMNQAISEYLRKITNFSIDSKINCLDIENKGIEGLYLTVLGTSADSADSGEVGRGNMANQVISPSRPAGAEATAGKNPVSHIGKIYNVLSFKIAKEIHRNISDLDEVFVWMYNVIGEPVIKPKAVVVQPISKKNIERVQKNQINEIVLKNIKNIPVFCKDLMYGRYEIV